MGQVFSRSRNTILILIVATALNIHLLLIIKPHFHEVPDTEVWFCLEWMALVTEGAVGLLWYNYKNKT